MSIESHASEPTPEIKPQSDAPLADLDGVAARDPQQDYSPKQALAAIASLQSQQQQAALSQARFAASQQKISSVTTKTRASFVTLIAIALLILGLALNNPFLGWIGILLTLLLSTAVLLPWLQTVVIEYISPAERSIFIALLGLVAAAIGIIKFAGIYRPFFALGKQINWEAFGTLAEWFGALGQILIAVIAVYVAWRQYVISKDLTIQQNLLTVQQNLITQQQTVDNYFQGISELVLDDQGLLEDWPQERALAEGRTAAILSSVDSDGKAKILRFLSSSRLLSPLMRDSRLGRAILNGDGGYAEDRVNGVRVIDLGVMLAGSDLAGADLRWTDLSDANLIRVDLSRCDLVKSNLARTILCEAKLIDADLKGTRFFYGAVETAMPRSRSQPPNYKTGAYTGAVIEDADFTNALRMSDALRCYCCAWGGEKTRATIPGGCEGIPNMLGR